MPDLATIKRINLDKYNKDKRLAFFTLEDTHKYLDSKSQKLNFVVDAMPTEILKSNLVGFDIETTGLTYPTSEIVGTGFWIPEYNMGYYFTSVEYVKEFLTRLDCPSYVAHNSKFDLKFLKLVGVEITGQVYDSMILHYLWNSGDRHGLKYLVSKCLGRHITTYEEAIKTNDPSVLAEYCISDCYNTLELHNWLMERFDNTALYWLELAARDVLVRMESVGIAVDMELADTKNLEIMLQIQAIKLELGWNPGSNNDVNVYLYEMYEVKGLPTTKTGLFSTSEQSLKDVAERYPSLYPKVSKILEYRKLKKTSSTYLIGIPEKTIKGILYTNFNQAVAATGRLSSSKPNMQNIPGSCRDILIARDGYSLVSLDYSQCELRILAELSQEPVLVKAYRDDIDVHTAVTAMLTNKPIDTITKEERRYGKTLNFGVIYGMSAHKLSVMVGIDLDAAQHLLDLYWEKMPGIKRWILSQYVQVLEYGFTETLMGRRRHFEFERLEHRRISVNTIGNFVLNKVKSPHDSAIFREAANHVIQGSNADITKIAMTRVPFDSTCRLLLQIHDELVFEIKDSLLDERIPEIVDCMTKAGSDLMQIPLKVDYSVSKSWSK